MEERNTEKIQKEREERDEEEKKELTREEMIEQIKKLEKRRNEIENETWRLMPKEIGEVLLKLLNKIWKEERNGLRG